MALSFFTNESSGSATALLNQEASDFLEATASSTVAEQSANQTNEQEKQVILFLQCGLKCGICEATVCGEVGGRRGVVVAIRTSVLMHCAMSFWWGCFMVVCWGR